MLVNFFEVCCFISQEGAFALAFKSTKFPGEIVATRFVAVYSSTITELKKNLPWTPGCPLNKYLSAQSKCAGSRPFGCLQRNICCLLYTCQTCIQDMALAALASAAYYYSQLAYYSKTFDWAELSNFACPGKT